ncbi:MAG: hypothetical protein U1F76_12850 [Candidatus Competibacteraceae bacterium]
MKAALSLLLASVLLLGGCAHQIAFQDAAYTISAERQNADIVVVIDPLTLNRVVSIRSFMTGIAHSWDAQPGEMLKQVADIELPQMFNHYQFATSYPQPQNQAIVLELSIPNYQFANFRADISVHAIAYGPNKVELLDKTYTASGETQGGKMFWGGAFGMKSAVRQSSLDAYQKIFVQLRGDLANVLKSSKYSKS